MAPKERLIKNDSNRNSSFTDLHFFPVVRKITKLDNSTDEDSRRVVKNLNVTPYQSDFFMIF